MPRSLSYTKTKQVQEAFRRFMGQFSFESVVNEPLAIPIGYQSPKAKKQKDYFS